MQGMRKILICSLTTLSIMSYNAHAKSTSNHTIVAPHCLIKNLDVPYETLSSTKSIALIQTGDSGLNRLVELKSQQKNVCGGFFNVTQSWKEFNTEHLANQNNAHQFLSEYTMATTTTSDREYHIRYENEVNQTLLQINPQNIWSQLTTLTQFNNRYADSPEGVEAANWFKQQVETIALETHHQDVKVYMVKTNDYKQPSVVVKMGESTEPGIVIGAHMDTVKPNDYMYSNLPGADDDGSGSITVLETARTLLASHLHFKKPIYFIWYAAEEGGLI